MYKTLAQILGLRSYPVDKDKLGKEWTSMKKDDNTNKIFDVCILRPEIFYQLIYLIFFRFRVKRTKKRPKNNLKMTS